MEIMPSKFRSPPPKPPRRRHSDQLTISPSGTYPSSRKKYHEESKFCMKEAQLKVVSSPGCGSLPANWTPDFSSDNKMENYMLFKNKPLSLTHLKNTYEEFQMAVNSVMDKDISELTDVFMETDCKDNVNFEWTKQREFQHSEQVVKSISSKFNTKNFLECLQNDTEIESNLSDVPSNTQEQKSFTKEYHRRHHSDPVFSYFDRSNSLSSLQKYIPKTHSVLENLSFDNQSKLCNSFNTSFEVKETQNLHEEIKNLKEVNNKLWQHLRSAQACLEKVHKNSEENTGSLSISDLLSSLYYSQKAKDCAMEDRMKVILEERDAAVQELENMVQIIARSFQDDRIEEEKKGSDKEIKELLKEIEVTYNPAKLLQQQRLLLTYLYRSKELKQDHIMHQLNIAVSEKNHFKEQVKFLEEELNSMKICNDLWNSDNKHWENNLLNILCQVIHQRDVALSKANISQNMERVSCRSGHENSRVVDPNTDDYEPLQKRDDVNISGIKRSHQSSFHEKHKCNSFSVESMSDEIRLLKGEILVLNKALEMEVEKRENAEERCLRLERLVNVLQRKVNGQNVGISV